MGKNKYLKRESYLKKLTIRQYYGEVKIIMNVRKLPINKFDV